MGGLMGRGVLNNQQSVALTRLNFSVGVLWW